MKSTLIALACALLLAGCQLPARVNGADAETQAIVAATAVATKAETVEACPVAPAPVDCPASQPATTITSEIKPSAPADSMVVAQSNEVTSEEKHTHETAMQEEPDASVAEAAEKSVSPEETLDIEKYVEQSASCVQQTPCSQDPVGDKHIAAPAVSDEAKVAESPKPASSNNTAGVSEKKASAGESGILRVERRRSASVKREIPPDMPR